MGLFESVNETGFERALQTKQYKPNGSGVRTGTPSSPVPVLPAGWRVAGRVRAAPTSVLSHPQVCIVWQEERGEQGLEEVSTGRSALPSVSHPPGVLTADHFLPDA